MQSFSPRIVMVGGGSYNWCPRLLSDLLQTSELDGAEVVLLDPNVTAASEVRAAGEAMAARLGKQCRIAVTASEEGAFQGADFVIITISTGGLEMMAHDLAIPERYGIFHTVGDTVGPGGWSRTLRNVPVFVHLARSIERHAPHAVVLNYTNPLATLTGTIARASNLRVVGLCHGVFENYAVLERLLGVEEKDLAVRFAGVNHFFWFLDLAVKGQPGYPLLRDKLSDKTLDEALGEGSTDAMGLHSHKLCNELYSEYGYLTYVGDRHTSEFLPGYVTPNLASLERYKLVRTTVQERYANRDAARQWTLELAAGSKAPPARSRETAVDIMVAFARGKPFTDVVNLPNVGQIDNLPRSAVVETLGLADGLGFRAVASGPLPPLLERLVSPHCQYQLMVLEAALKGDRKLALEALMVDPLCAHLSPSQVHAMGLELMEATRDWLPQFS
jgi:alpha-galactosidase